MMGQLVLQGLANGLLIAGLYVLIAAGLALIFGTMRLANFAHGDMLMVGMYLAFFGVAGAGISLYWLPLVIVPVMFAVGVGTYYLIVRPIIDQPPETLLLTMVGVALLLQNLALIAFSARPRSAEDPLGLASFRVAGVSMGQSQVLAALISGVVVAGLALLLHRTDIGRAIRATSEDRQAAQAAGIDINKINGFAFGIGIACLGLAAPLLMPFFLVSPTIGLNWTLIGFLIIVMGGLGSFRGAIVAALLVGIADGLGGVLLGGAYARALLFGLFVVVLVFRPSGLFGVERL